MNNMKRTLITMGAFAVAFTITLYPVTGFSLKSWAIASILSVFATFLGDILRALLDKGCGGNCKCKNNGQDNSKGKSLLNG